MYILLQKLSRGLPVVLSGLFMLVLQFSAVAGLSDVLKPPVTREDHLKIIIFLELTATETEASNILFDGYLSSFTQQAEQPRSLANRLDRSAKEKRDDLVPLRLAYLTSFELFVKRKDLMCRDYILSIKSLVGVEHLDARSPAVDRYTRRKLARRASPRAATLWHEVDVVRCVDASLLEVHSRVQIQDLLIEYEHSVDMPLARLERLFWGAGNTWLDPTDEELGRVGEGVGAELAAINRKYVRWLLDILPAVEGRRLLFMVREQAYPSLDAVVGVRLRCLSLRDRVNQIKDLTSDQVILLEAAYASCEADLERAEEITVANFDEADGRLASMKEADWGLLINQPSAPGNPALHAIQQTFDRCIQIQNDFEQRLRSGLTVAQRDAVWPEK